MIGITGMRSRSASDRTVGPIEGTKPVVLHQDAEAELDAAMAYYENQRPGLGLDLQAAPMLSLQEYANAIEQGWPEEDLGRAIIHDLPRRFRALSHEAQKRVIESAPALTGTRWDALLAATVEHLCELHGHAVQPWMDEPERFLNETWVLAWTPSIWSNALAFAPPAFVRHGAVPDPRELDERGGERRAWVPE